MKMTNKTSSLFLMVLMVLLLTIVMAGCRMAEEDTDDTDEESTDDLLPAPTDLRAEITGQTVTLYWVPVPNAEYYAVYRSTDNENFNILNGAILSTVFYDSLAKEDGTYVYKIAAREHYANDPLGKFAEISVTINTPIQVKNIQVKNIQSTALSTSEIKVVWSAVAGASKYRIYRGEDYIPENMVSIADKDVSATEFTDTSLEAKTTYYYRIAIIDSNDKEHALSSTYTWATTQVAPAPAPTNVTATAYGRVITLEWDAVKGASGSYIIYVAFAEAGPYAAIGTLGTTVGTTVYNVSTITPNSGIPLSPDTTYYFKVSAGNTGLLSAPVSATTGP